MVKIIAHRGNLNGPLPENENQPHQLIATLSGGFDLEIDVWVVSGQVFFGHDEPKFEVPKDLIRDIQEESWYHCKNLEALEMFDKEFPTAKYFWHENDAYTLTSNGYIWTYPGQEVTEKSIIVDLGPVDISKYPVKPYGICTDYPNTARQ